MIKHGYDRFTQRFYLSLCNTAVPMLFLYELSCILYYTLEHCCSLRLGDYFFLAEGRLLVVLFHESCTNTHIGNTLRKGNMNYHEFMYKFMHELCIQSCINIS